MNAFWTWFFTTIFLILGLILLSIMLFIRPGGCGVALCGLGSFVCLHNAIDAFRRRK